MNGLAAVDVEHFDPSLKGNDDYYNYYAVLHSVNMWKAGRERHKDAEFFESRFFQNQDQFDKRIRYVAQDCVYVEVDPEDEEARLLIEFLGFNNPDLAKERKKHLEFLCDPCFSWKDRKGEFVSHLSEHQKLLSFATAIEAEFDLDLSGIIENLD